MPPLSGATHSHPLSDVRSVGSACFHTTANLGLMLATPVLPQKKTPVCFALCGSPLWRAVQEDRHRAARRQWDRHDRRHWGWHGRRHWSRHGRRRWSRHGRQQWDRHVLVYHMSPNFITKVCGLGSIPRPPDAGLDRLPLHHLAQPNQHLSLNLYIDPCASKPEGRPRGGHTYPELIRLTERSLIADSRDSVLRQVIGKGPELTINN